MSLHYGVPFGYDMTEMPSYPPVSESTNFTSNTYKNLLLNKNQMFVLLVKIHI